MAGACPERGIQSVGVVSSDQNAVYAPLLLTGTFREICFRHQASDCLPCVVLTGSLSMLYRDPRFWTAVPLAARSPPP